MKRLILVLGVTGLMVVTARSAALYDGFDYSPPGTALGGLSPQAGSTWQAGVQSGSDQTIASGSLTYPGLATSTGNSLAVNVTAKVDRIWSSSLPASVASGTIYYSLLLQITDLTGLNQTTAAGAFFAGFNNSLPTSTANASQVGARLQVLHGSDASHYVLGIRNDVSTATGTSAIAYDTTQFSTADTVLVVVGYTFNSGSSIDDVASLWINPTPGGAQPAPNVTSTGGDINTLQIQSFLFRPLTGNLMPPGVVVDELRIDTTWAGVTPTSVPEPSTAALLGLGVLGLIYYKRTRSK